MSTVRTIRAGNTATERLVLRTSAAPTPDPGVSDSGYNLQGSDYLHIYVEVPGTMTSATVTPWFYSNIADTWFEGNALTFNATTKFAVVETRGEERIFFVVDTIAGTGELKIWAGYSFDEPGRE